MNASMEFFVRLPSAKIINLFKNELLATFNLPIDTGYAFVTKASLLKKGPPWKDSFKWKDGLLKEIQANMRKINLGSDIRELTHHREKL
jgi:hypothetical protein